MLIEIVLTGDSLYICVLSSVTNSDIQILPLFMLLWFRKSALFISKQFVKIIIWIRNIYQVYLIKSNRLKWRTLILKLVWNCQRSQGGKRGFLIHFVCFTFSYLLNMYWLYSFQLWPSIWLLHVKDHEIFVMSEVPK